MSDESQPAFIDIVALAGGDESHVFVDMVLNMYRLWAYGNDRDFRLIEPSGTSALRPRGRAKLCIANADWRMLAARENGVHRLIRLPPGGSQRHTSFVGVLVSDSADTAHARRRQRLGRADPLADRPPRAGPGQPPEPASAAGTSWVCWRAISSNSGGKKRDAEHGEPARPADGSGKPAPRAGRSFGADEAVPELDRRLR